tara:strand:- start:763 stop:1029 length:267 start_codon:yes stop_codon:yes gene_type:complete
MMKKIYIIEWQDAVSQTGWDELDSELPMICYTVGAIVLETPERVCIASSWSEEDDTLGDITHIPPGMIKSKRLLHPDLRTCEWEDTYE